MLSRPGASDRTNRRRHVSPLLGLWPRSSPVAAKRGVADAGLEVGHKPRDYQNGRLVLVRWPSSRVNSYERSVPSKAFWHLNRLKVFNMTAQLQHGIERFRCRAVCQAGWQVVPPFLKLVQHVRQRLYRVSPPFRPTAPIGRPTVPDSHRRLRRRSRGSKLAPRPVSRGSLGGGRGAVAAGRWSRHPRILSRDASRVQWRSFVNR
jgi:hypothetical protein